VETGGEKKKEGDVETGGEKKKESERENKMNISDTVARAF